MMQTTNDTDENVNGHTFDILLPLVCDRMFTLRRLSFIFLCDPTNLSACVRELGHTVIHQNFCVPIIYPLSSLV